MAKVSGISRRRAQWQDVRRQVMTKSWSLRKSPDRVCCRERADRQHILPGLRDCCMPWSVPMEVLERFAESIALGAPAFWAERFCIEGTIFQCQNGV